ncbi:MAG TPA: ubiquinone/menaquinone biosynthesis methyltransferase [Candidatus Binataceae bacterium]|nr:ubiquinone/menaquinone biosynthesis methyltransferase [Candidatus Binataceae bacterium]
MLPAASSRPSAELSKAVAVRAMFARIVPRYDLVNRLMSLGMDRRWRRLAVAAAQPQGAVALDAATGTGDLITELERQGSRMVVGADFCPEMVFAAAAKLGRAPHRGLLAADVLQLPFPDSQFDCIVNGFLLRNVANLDRAFEEFRRVLKPGGRLVCLDLTPAPRWLRPLLWPYFALFVPLLGGLISGDFAAYRYLPASVHSHPQADELCRRMVNAGLEQASYRRLNLGTIALHLAYKPAVARQPLAPPDTT